MEHQQMYVQPQRMNADQRKMNVPSFVSQPMNVAPQQMSTQHPAQASMMMQHDEKATATRTMLKVKVTNEGDTRIWRYFQVLDFTELKRFITAAWDDEKLIPQYRDDDGDMITITSFHDLADAVKCVQCCNKSTLMITVRNDVNSESVSKSQLQKQIQDLRAQISFLMDQRCLISSVVPTDVVNPGNGRSDRPQQPASANPVLQVQSLYQMNGNQGASYAMQPVRQSVAMAANSNRMNQSAPRGPRGHQQVQEFSEEMKQIKETMANNFKAPQQAPCIGSSASMMHQMVQPMHNQQRHQFQNMRDVHGSGPPQRPPLPVFAKQMKGDAFMSPPEAQVAPSDSIHQRMREAIAKGNVKDAVSKSSAPAVPRLSIPKIKESATAAVHRPRWGFAVQETPANQVNKGKHGDPVFDASKTRKKLGSLQHQRTFSISDIDQITSNETEAVKSQVSGKVGQDPKQQQARPQFSIFNLNKQVPPGNVFKAPTASAAGISTAIVPNNGNDINPDIKKKMIFQPASIGGSQKKQSENNPFQMAPSKENSEGGPKGANPGFMYRGTSQSQSTSSNSSDSSMTFDFAISLRRHKKRSNIQRSKSMAASMLDLAPKQKSGGKLGLGGKGLGGIGLGQNEKSNDNEKADGADKAQPVLLPSIANMMKGAFTKSEAKGPMAGFGVNFKQGGFSSLRHSQSCTSFSL